MITYCWPGWYRVDVPIYTNDVPKVVQWCKDNIGFSDKDTWVYQNSISGSPGRFSFKDEKWALMFLLRWAG